MGKSRRGGHTGRPTGSGTTFQRDFQDAQQERRYIYAMATANGALNQTETCKVCGGQAGCINAAVLKNLGVRAYWMCADCGREYTKEISPEKMELYYQEDLAKMHSEPQEAHA